VPTYEVTFKVEYDHTVLVEARDEDEACELAGDMVKALCPVGDADVEFYDCRGAKA
jgi:hypothetical protein